VTTYLIHATTVTGHHLGHVTTVGAVPTLLVAWLGSLWLRGIRLEIEAPVRTPNE